VRTCLRKNEPLKLILTEIPKNYRDKKFPPIFRLEPDELFNFYRIEDSSPYFWYPPVPNIRKHLERLSIERDIRSKTRLSVPPEKQRISLTHHRYVNGGST